MKLVFREQGELNFVLYHFSVTSILHEAIQADAYYLIGKNTS
jgi:hypothetical protein